MHRYIVVAHKTLGGEHLLDELHRLREIDPHCTFHLLVPEHHHKFRVRTGHGHPRSAQSVLDEMLERLASMRIGATGEVSTANPVDAVGAVVHRETKGAFAGIILSTLPKGISQWWMVDVPTQMAVVYPDIPLTHVVAKEAITA
jgi:hypothetical protein